MGNRSFFMLRFSLALIAGEAFRSHGKNQIRICVCPYGKRTIMNRFSLPSLPRSHDNPHPQTRSRRCLPGSGSGDRHDIDKSTSTPLHLTT
ncbi:hypothetical protein F4804DRAFT_164962 [Jackrogersella minutella]|nr:hypothetical protein F4804DRAFT_164962 [Jackrogersella minutella]